MTSNKPALLCEQLLCDEMPEFEAKQALVISPGHGQLASELCEKHQVLNVSAWYIDLYAAAVAGALVDSRVEVHCSADLPDDQFDLVCMPVLKKGEAELTRDLLQQSHARLRQGGLLVVSVDNPRDQWLHEQMQNLFDKVSCDRRKSGCVYWGRKRSELKKVKLFEADFIFRDEDNFFNVVTRPGVFSHRRVDPGARQLMLSAEIGESDNVLDMGCGSGTVAMAAAKKTSGRVFGVDSNARAVECFEANVARNQITTATAILNADGALELPCEIDIALANPPYYGDDRISEHFVKACLSVLRPGGALLVVTKRPNWYGAYFNDLLDDIAIFEAAKYWVACGRKP